MASSLFCKLCTCPGILKTTLSHSFHSFFFAIDIVTFLIFSIYLLKTFQLPVKKMQFSRKAFLILVIGLVSLVLIGNLYNLLLWIFPVADMNAELNTHFVNEFPLTGFIFACIMAPVIEEIFNRGVFFELFFQELTRWRPILLIMVSGLIFGSFHVLVGGFAWQNLLSYSLMGWVFGAIYYFSKDLKVGILVHSFYNMFCQFAPFIFSLLWKFLI